MSQVSCSSWAHEELDMLDLGHASRERCAREVLAAMARGSGTRVTDFAEDSAARQQAYGFIENDSVEPEALTTAAAQAALKRLDQSPSWCVVAVDGSSLNLADEHGKKGFGRIGGQDATRGLIVHTAMAISSSGLPLGLLGQKYWARPMEKSPPGFQGERRKTSDKETAHWLEVVATAEAAGVSGGRDGRLWFQMDRGYDCFPLLDHMGRSSNRFTIRGQYNRALWAGESKEEVGAAEAHGYVEDALDAAPVLEEMSIRVEKNGARRSERVARLRIQVAEVDVRLTDHSRRKNARDGDGKRRKKPVQWPRTLTVLRIMEIGSAPTPEEPLKWMLWVNFPVTTVEEARTVVSSYALRWRVEEFHRMWKSGSMKVEQTQARSGENVERIARLSALVACRILRLTHLARETPEADAREELSRFEIAVLTHMDPRSPKQAPRQEPKNSFAWAMAVIADMGGYTGKSSGGPPGPMVIARGFQRMIDRAHGFAAAMAIRDQW